MARFSFVCVPKCLLLLWLSNIAISAGETPEECNCIPLKQCDSITNFLKSSPRPISTHTKQELRKYVCTAGNPTTVCCPSKAITIPLEEYSPSPPDVINHRNLNLLPKDCGSLTISDKLLDGIHAALNEFPWMTLLSYKTKSGPQFRCAGTILNENYILTAAHCISNLSSPLLGVRVGEYDISKKIDCEIVDVEDKICAEPVQDLSIEEIIPHPQYSKEHLSNNIGLLRVEKMKFKENVKPVCLPVSEESKNRTLRNTVNTGWGYAPGANRSNILQKVSLSVVNITRCEQAYTQHSPVKITYKNICTEGRGNDQCVGEGGGPLQALAYVDEDVRYIQYGILSFGHRLCSLEEFPSVYTNLLYYVDWILDNIKA